MNKKIRRLMDFMKVLSFDTHLWCISVIGGAILLCASFFINPVERFLVLNGNVVNAKENSIEVVLDQKYSSVLGGSPEQIVDSEETTGEINVVEEESSVSLEEGLPVSVEDFDALCRIIECEARGEDLKGRILVGNVVMNRVSSEKFPNSIEEVIKSPGQFDPVTSGAYEVVETSSMTKEAAMRVLNGEDYSQGALYFQKSESEIWGDKTFLFRYNSHSFYK